MIRVSDPRVSKGPRAYICTALISARDAFPRQAGGKGDLGVHLRWAFLPACRGKGHLMDLVCACNGLLPLCVEEEAVSWTWCALAMRFPHCLSRKWPSHALGGNARDGLPPCLSRKRPSHGLGVRLRAAFPGGPGGPQKCPGSSRSQNMQFLLTNVILK